MQNMFPELGPIVVLVSVLRGRLAEARRNPEAGYSAEAVIVIGALVVAAIAIATWIASQITQKGSTITIP
jgi:hypothetical protein